MYSWNSRLDRTAGHHSGHAAMMPMDYSNQVKYSLGRNLALYESFVLQCVGDVIGVHYKSQPQPKPIYAHSRVKLRKYTEDGFPKDFVNANMVHPGGNITASSILLYRTKHDCTTLFEILIRSTLV